MKCRERFDAKEKWRFSLRNLPTGPGSNSGLQQKILLFFIVVIFIPTVILLVFIYNMYLQFMKEKIQLYTHQMVKEINNNIDSNLKIYSRLTLQIYANKEIIENMKKEHRDFNEQFEIEKTIRAVLRSLISADRYVASAYLITSDHTKYVDGIEFPGLDEEFEKYDRIASKAGGRIVWLPSKEHKDYFGKDYHIFMAVREIKSYDGTRVGTLILVLREEFFADIYKEVYFGENVNSMILTSDLFIVSSMNKDLIGEELSGEGYLQKIARIEEGTFVQNTGGQDFLVVFSTSQITDWKFVSIIPMKDLLKEVWHVRNIMLLIIVLFIFFLFLLSYLFSQRIIFPLKKLLAGIKRVEEGDLNISIDNKHNDEIGRLSRSFESMLTRVRGLLEEVREKEKLKSQLELDALQSQINPHFMYNTLNSIKWMAIINKQDNIKKMLNALMKMLKMAADTSQELITVKDEIELLKSYIFVQSVRFTNFKTEYHIPEEVLSYKIIKFTLQPIVENSIIHGFGSSDRLGVIRISVRHRDEKLYIEVKDDGVGIKPEEVDTLLNGENGTRYNKLGIRNVHERIVLHYGPEYGLRIRSQFGEGTTVTVILPVIK